MAKILLKLKVHEVFAIMAWFIWAHRNKLRLQEQSVPLSGIREAVYNFLQLFRSCCEQSGSTKMLRQCKWKPPNLDEYKINFDGAMFNEYDKASVGIMVQDSRSLVVATMAEKKKKKKNPFCRVFKVVGSKACCALHKGNWVTTVTL